MPYLHSRPYKDNKRIALHAVTGLGVPTAPHGLTHSAVSDSSITVAWVNGSSTQTSVEIQFRTGEVWSASTTLGAAVTSYELTGLSASTIRGFRVRGVNAAGNSEWSNVIVDATTETGSVLPDDYWWQRVLRAWLDTHIQSDFDVTLTSVPDVIASMTDEEIWNAMVVGENRGFNSPNTKGFRVNSSHFTLSSIESGSQINMKIGRGDFFEPQAIAFYAYWENPLNVHYDDDTLYRRALVGTAVDSIMGIDSMYNGGSTRSDYVGGYMAKWAITYWLYKNHPGTAPSIGIDSNVDLAFLETISLTWDIIKDGGGGGNGGADLEAFQLKAAPYVYDLGLITKAEYIRRVSYVISVITNPQGGFGWYHDHGGGTEIAIDMSYEGIMTSFMAEAAISEFMLVPNVSLIKDALKRSYEFMSNMLSIEQEKDNGGEHLHANADFGTIYGPSHFNTGSAGIPDSQWSHPMKRWEASYLFDDVRWQIHGYHNSPYYVNQKKVLSRDDMINVWGVSTWRTAVNTTAGAGGNDWITADSSTPAVWSASHWMNRLPMLAVHRVIGWWSGLWDYDQNGTDEALLKPPCLRDADYTKYYAHMMTAKLGNLQTVVHMGPVVSEWAGDPSALRGGVSSWYIKDVAPFVMGVGTGGQSNPADNWSNVDEWAVNTICGITSTGAFSEARFLGEEINITEVDVVGRRLFGFLNGEHDVTSLFKKGDLITLENWTTGDYHVLTLSQDATFSNYRIPFSDTSMEFHTVEAFPWKEGETLRLHSVGSILTDESFYTENRSLIDSTKISRSCDSTTVSELVVNRKISGTSEKTTVSVEYTSEGQEAITDMYESIPVLYGWDHPVFDQLANIQYWNGSAWTDLTTTEVSSRYIRLIRDLNKGDGEMYAYISFDSPENLRVSNAIVEKTGGTYGVSVRNIKIRMGHTNIFPRRKLTYHLLENNPV